jgi:hypothetical protein
MVDFRRWITALAVLALFAGLAFAQVPGGTGGNGPLTCNASVAVPPALRAEGLTELIGDIVITCSGGTALTAGAIIPTANITVSLQTNVTSRLLGSGGVSNASEALLLIDEPGTNLIGPVTGFGPAAPLGLCSTPGVGAGTGGCVEYANSMNGFPVATAVSLGSTPGPNVFQGLVSANQVTFQGIPILAPVSANNSRVYRITNIRANVNGIGAAGLAGVTPLVASISISGSTSLPVNNPVLNAGFIQNGLSTAYRNANQTGSLASGGAFGINQCSVPSSPTGFSVVQFTENFGTAFKTRVAPTATYNGQSSTPNQSTPGTIYNSESGFVYTSAAGNGYTAGLADYGTRLKAVFNNIPAGIRIFVSVTNLAANVTSPNTSITSGTATSSFAQLVNGEASPDSNGFAPLLSPTTSVNSSTTGVFELPQSGGSATAVWEVINTNPAQQETLSFGVWYQYVSGASTASNTPAPGTATANLSFAPTPPIPFSATAGATASGSLTIPRFADTSTARQILSVSICQTLLLFPFVTNQSGFDTGLSIANTSTDPIATGAQSGTCQLTWYDGTGKTPATNLKVTDFTNATTSNSGTVWANLASALAPGFQGYMFALCNFQYAHGFAFISDLGARNLAMGYLALVVNNGAVARGNAPAAESLAH